MVWALVWLHQLWLPRNQPILLLHEVQNHLPRLLHVLPRALELRQKQAVTVADVLLLELHQVRVVLADLEILALRELALGLMLL